jgi:hypothetical protein
MGCPKFLSKFANLFDRHYFAAAPAEFYTLWKSAQTARLGKEFFSGSDDNQGCK